MTVPLCYYGSPDPLPERRELRAGPLTAVYEAGDLRYVKVGGVEVCRRWYAAVRDHNWGTVPGVISDEVIEQTADAFRVTYASTHRQGDVHFVWRAQITATYTPAKEGVTSFPIAGVSFAFDGEAKSTFLRNRIGQCVLHPIQETAGKRVTVQPNPIPGGPPYLFTHFPTLIAPRNPFAGFDQLAIVVSDDTTVLWQFHGADFETEDQRNWIDASFKTFCTPLSRPFPVEVKAGDGVRQHVAMGVILQSVVGVPAEADAQRGDAGGPRCASASAGVASPDLRIGRERAVGRLPALGLTTASDGPPHTTDEIERLERLHPAHLRVEIDCTRADATDRLAEAVGRASEIGCGLEVALVVSDAVADEVPKLLTYLARVVLPVRRLVVYHDREWGTPGRVVGPVIATLASLGLDIPIFGGTRANFTELNRNRPPLDWLEGVCYSVQPQEHAFDNASLVECCAIIADTVRSARAFCGAKPIAVGPITLRKRVNPYATGPAAPVPPGELPPTVDPRQMSLFGAAWTLGALKYLAESGVESVTFYETTGWLGVMESTHGCTLPHLFPSKPGMVFPLFHVLADATELADAAVLRSESADPLRFDALALQTAAGPRLLLANMTAEPQTVTIDGWFEGEVRVRTLDETTFDYATSDPVAFRRDRGDPIPVPGGRLTLSLKPYAYVRIDG